MHTEEHEHRRGRRFHHERGPNWRGHRAMFGGQWFGPPPWAGRRRRGDVRAAILAVLAEGPMHGYDLIGELEQRSGGMWRPSPGSVYPTLQMLEDADLVTAQEQDGKRVYSLTDAGRAEVEARKERGGSEPWEFGGGSEALTQLRDSAFQLAAAAMQVARAGAEPQMKRAAEILAEARKKIYAILAGD